MIKQPLRNRRVAAQTKKKDSPARAKPFQSSRWSPFIYRVTIESDADRFYAEVPLLPGCYSWGYSYEEALGNIKDAIELWLGAKKESHEPIPVERPSTIRSASLTVGVLV